MPSRPCQLARILAGGPERCAWSCNREQCLAPPRGHNGMTAQSQTALYIACNPQEPWKTVAAVRCRCQLIVQEACGAEPEAEPKDIY